MGNRLLTVSAISHCCCWAESCLESVSDARWQFWKKLSLTGAFKGNVCLGNLDDRKRNLSAATCNMSCKFRSRFAANALSFTSVRMKDEFFFEGQIPGSTWTTKMKSSDALGKVKTMKVS